MNHARPAGPGIAFSHQDPGMVKVPQPSQPLRGDAPPARRPAARSAREEFEAGQKQRILDAGVRKCLAIERRLAEQEELVREMVGAELESGTPRDEVHRWIAGVRGADPERFLSS